MNVEKKAYEKYAEEMIGYRAVGRALRQLRKQEDLKRGEFITKYSLGGKEGLEEQSLYRWENRGIVPRKDALEKIKKIPNFNKEYEIAKNDIVEEGFIIQVGDRKIDIIETMAFYEEVDDEQEALYHKNKKILKGKRNDYSILLRTKKYFDLLSEIGAHDIDFYPIMLLLLETQNKQKDNEFIETDFRNELEIEVSNLQKSILEKFIGE